MKGPWCVLPGVFVLASACATPPPRVEGPEPMPAAPAVLMIGVHQAGRLQVQRVPLEPYVEAAALSEFAPPSDDPAVVEQMLEVQAVISRTYALAHLHRHAADGFDLCDTTHCQLYEPARRRTSRWASAAHMAIGNTAARVLWYDGGPVMALFHADCGGSTSSAADVWGGPSQPYLRAMEDDGPAASAHAAWQFQTTVTEARRALNADSRTAVGDRLEGLTMLDRDASGRAKRIALHGEHERMVTGEQLRDVLTRAFGVRTIKSTLFSVRRTRESMVFEGRGFGHGVGLCQAGALARIRAGATVAAVLQRYFPGTRLVTLSQ